MVDQCILYDFSYESGSLKVIDIMLDKRACVWILQTGSTITASMQLLLFAKLLGRNLAERRRNVFRHEHIHGTVYDNL